MKHFMLYCLCLFGLLCCTIINVKADEWRPLSLSEERGPVFIQDVIADYNRDKVYPETISPHIVWESFVGTDTDIIFTYTLLERKAVLLFLNFEGAARHDKGDASCEIFAVDIENLERVIHRYYDIDHVYVFEVEFTEYDCMLF